MENPIIPLYKQIDKLIVRSKGCYQYDSDEKQYIDFESGDWSANLGHSNERIIQALQKQSELLIHDGLRFRNKPSEELSFRLLEKLSLKEGKSVFLNSGSEAVNLGITLARNLTKRKKVLKMDCSFLSSYGFGQISPNNPDLVSVPFDNMEAIAEIDFESIALFVFEPGNSQSLIKYPSNEFITAIAQMVKEHGGLLMANEVTTGFGRTGKWFGHQYYDYKPDIVSMGKALGNGYPVSCVSISSEAAVLFDKSPFRYAQSHQNDPLGCAIGLEVINILEEDELVEQSFSKGEYFKEQLFSLKTMYPAKIKEIRARGLMIALEFEKTVNAEELYLELIEQGFLVGQKENLIRFMPPLIIEKQHIDKLIEAIEKNLSK